MLPVRSPAPNRGSAGPSQNLVQPLTWATLPRVAQVLALLALVHLLAVLAASIHSHSTGGGVVLFPLAKMFSSSTQYGRGGSAGKSGSSAERVSSSASPNFFTVLRAELEFPVGDAASQQA